MNMEERLIAAVTTFPELYNPAVREYRDIGRRAVAWRFIGFQLGISEEDAKRRWRSLRDRYRKEHTHNEKERRSGSAAEHKKVWRFMPLLRFLNPYIQEKSTCSKKICMGSTDVDSLSQEEPSPMQSDAEVSCSPATSDLATPLESPSLPAPGSSGPSPGTPLHRRIRPRPKRARTERADTEAHAINTISHRYDEQALFGLSLAATLRRLSPVRRRLARCRIEQLLYEVEFGEKLIPGQAEPSSLESLAKDGV
ncbi:transcription factor Adf-1-like [Thunnus albacares]|uniref:transcription factor Adf-1-like n=1 Tax=Thunnus albacares TaxID=8236 RepID=UPI001CF69F3A|nr:transcription factor Adf-1-like [Thunnus albacares]